MAFHTVGVPQDKGNANDGEDNPAEETVFQAGENGEIRDALRYADGEGIEHSPGKAHMGSNIAHADTHDGIIPHGDGQGNEDNDKGDGLLAHAKNSTEEAEHNHDEGNDDVLDPQPLEEFVTIEPQDPAQERHDANLDGAAVVEDVESTSDHKDENDDVGFVNKTVEESRKDLPGLGVALNVAERVVAHHLAESCGAVGILDSDGLADKLAGRHKPRADSGKDDEGENDSKGMRYLFHAAVGVGCWGQGMEARKLLR